MNDESTVQQQVQIHGMYFNSNLMRNNVGAYEDDTGRWVRYGLGNISKKHNDEIKSSDLIGITTVTVTPDMVGMKFGIFTAIECKHQGWKPDKKLDKHERAQKAFIDWVRSLGGFAGFARSIIDLPWIIKFRR